MWIKICGCRTHRGVDAAVAAGADAVGFVLAESRRRVTFERARVLLDRVPSGVARVGVLRGATRREVMEILRALPLDMLQLSGPVPKGIPGDIGLLRTVYLGAEDRLPTGRLPRGGLLHLDRRVSGLPGGRGQTVNFDAARRLVLAGRRVVLSGGLTPENVAEAVRAVNPYGVDVASGVEQDGEQDPERIQRFVKAAREATA